MNAARLAVTSVGCQLSCQRLAKIRSISRSHASTTTDAPIYAVTYLCSIVSVSLDHSGGMSLRRAELAQHSTNTDVVAFQAVSLCSVAAAAEGSFHTFCTHEIV